MSMKKMAPKQQSRQKNTEESCVVCFKSFDIYGVGECDHPVCYECSTRMRVLISVKDCPICRKEMSQVVFLKKKNLVPFKDIQTRCMSYDSRHAIYFESDKEMAAYDRLLEHACLICHESRTFTRFEGLREHVQRNHQLFYCELCLDNLKLFSKERKPYSRTDLALHRRKGDANDTSHRGHPLCEFCDTRFMDNDELFRHLRKDHFYCHFCDADGKKEYYLDYNALRVHFRDCHFLCEEGNCVNEQFTSVFRYKLDKQAHHLEVHAESKEDIRLARTLDLEFSLNHGPALVDRSGGMRGRRGRGGSAGSSRPQQSQASAPVVPDVPPPNLSVDINCAENFPTLSGEASGNNRNNNASMAISSSGKSFNASAMRGNIANRVEDFPSLLSSHGRASNGPAASTSSRSTNVQSSSSQAQGKSKNKNAEQSRNLSSFDYTKAASANRGVIASNRKTLQVQTNKAKSSFSNKENSEEYPTLGNPSKSLQHVFRQVDTSTVGSQQPAISFSVRNTEPAKPKKVKNTNTKEFSVNDFPSLSTGKGFTLDNNKKGVSKGSQNVPKAAFPLTKPLVSQNGKQKIPSNGVHDVNTSGVKKKKPKPEAIPFESISNNNKKKPPRLRNIFDESDEDEEQFNVTKPGEYTSLGPVASSNVKLITREQLNGERQKTHSSFVPAPSLSAQEFPSLLGGKSKQSTVVDTSWSTNANKKAKNNKNAENNSSKAAKKNEKPVVWKEFMHPLNFDERNRNLIKIVSDECKGNNSKFNRFKNVSKSFRAGSLDGRDYYKQCRELMGKDVMLKILPELLLLLPDIGKQQSVLSGFKELDSGSKCEVKQFVSCPKCSQVLCPHDRGHHDAQHLELEFPNLKIRK